MESRIKIGINTMPIHNKACTVAKKTLAKAIDGVKKIQLAKLL
jgi:hypothetical protein